MRNKITYLLACLIVSGSSLAQSVYKDNSYSPEERAEDLVKQLTLEEKVSLMMDNSKPCLLYTSPSPRDRQKSRMPSSA